MSPYFLNSEYTLNARISLSNSIWTSKFLNNSYTGRYFFPTTNSGIPLTCKQGLKLTKNWAVFSS